MIEVIFFGRGGQGGVTAAEVLATAVFFEGKYSQAFPSFTGDRRGAPVTAYARIHDDPILDRRKIVKADYVVVLDPKLLETSNPLGSLKEEGCAIINVNISPNDIKSKIDYPNIEIFCIDATKISDDIYGKRPIPITNIAMLGAFASATGLVQMESIFNALENYFTGERANQVKQSAERSFNQMERAKGS